MNHTNTLQTHKFISAEFPSFIILVSRVKLLDRSKIYDSYIIIEFQHRVSSFSFLVNQTEREKEKKALPRRTRILSAKKSIWRTIRMKKRSTGHFDHRTAGARTLFKASLCFLNTTIPFLVAMENRASDNKGEFDLRTRKRFSQNWQEPTRKMITWGFGTKGV